MAEKRLIVGVSGASGICIAEELLRLVGSQNQWETHLIVSDSARQAMAYEYPKGEKGLAALATRLCRIGNLADSVSSGTYTTEGMVIIPCSMKTVAGIASGYSDNLLLRAADVVLKERRKLVLVPRETPLSTIHCRNLLELSRLGVILVPPVMTFYNHAQTIPDMVRHIACKALEPFGMENLPFQRWS